MDGRYLKHFGRQYNMCLLGAYGLISELVRNERVDVQDDRTLLQEERDQLENLVEEVVPSRVRVSANDGGGDDCIAFFGMKILLHKLWMTFFWRTIYAKKLPQ